MSLGETFGEGAVDSRAGGSEMGSLMRAVDWSKTALGSVEGWSRSLRMMVNFLLANRFPLLLWWGPDYISIYNDAYRPILGTKHPKSMGQPVSECWSEIWHILKPLIDTPFYGGPATWMEDIELEINRHGFIEETHFTIAYSPVPDESAPRGIGGVLATVHEITEKVVSERRVGVLRDLGARAMEAKSAKEACGLVATVLENHPRDVPFALLYLIDSEAGLARLAGASGVGPGKPISPTTAKVDIASSGTDWPLGEALREGEIIAVEDLSARFAKVPPGPWADPPQCGVVVPVRSSKADQLAGFLVAGVSARLRLDDLYRAFYDLMAGQIALAITNARAYEEERTRAEQLAEIDRAKTLFFSNVSHEFRTPLSLIIGPLTDALAARRGLEGAQLELAYRNSLRLLKLVNSLLDFSRIEAGRAEAVYVATDLARLTSELVSNFRSACERAGLSLAVACEPLSSPVRVDRDMWEKIVLNLLSNAFKFTFEGEIEVHLREVEGFAELSVRDTGVGIPANELPRLFERFHRIEGQQSRTHEGSGIGLALVLELVKLHGGTIEVQSTVDRGTTFTVRVPFGAAYLSADRNAARQRLPSTSLRAEAFVQEALRWLPDEAGGDAALLDNLSEPEAAAALQSGSRVLIADDNADMREYVRGLLGRRCEVRTVADGKAALTAIREHRPNLVLADVMMPEMDGFGLLREIRGDPAMQDIPVILLSARAGEESRVEGLEAGADDYLVKPFAARELIARVSANLELARVRAEATAALRESEQRYRALATASSYAVYRMNADWTQMLHLEGRGFIADTQSPSGDWLRDYIHADDQPTVTAAIRKAIATKSMFELEHPVRRIDGTVGWTHSRAVPLLDQNGEIVEWFGAASDATDRKRAELALRALNETLEERVEAEVTQRMKAEEALRQAQKMEAIGHLTGGIAHDFNNLLQVVLGNLDGLHRRVNGPAAPSRGDIVRSVEGAIRGAERAAILTHRLLAFSRRQPLEPRLVDVNRLVTGMSELLRRTLGESVAIETVLGGGLWQIFADPNQLENSILNLAVNARDAMPGSGKLTIETANAHLDEAYASEQQEVQPGQYVMIVLSDTGIGMTKEVAEAAFDPFFTTKAPGHGTGLGLSQVYGFVKQSNGHVKIYSERGEGTTVRIYLPRLVGDALVKEEALPRSVPSGDGSETILLVEDDGAVRELNARMLRELNYAVIEAEDGARALQILEAYPNIHVLFTDVGLPRGINGRQLADEALRLRPNLRVLFTSGYARNAIVHHGRLDPGIDLISKPFTTALLAVKIRELLDRP
jgi:signal transduction histidine kinase